MTLLVAAEDDGDLRVVERASFLHGTQRGEHHDETALHVVDAWSGDDLAVCVGHDRILLEGTGGLEYGIHVPDEQQPLAAFAIARGTRMLGNQIASSLYGGFHRLPVDGEAQGLEVGRDDVLDRDDSGQVHRAAVDVDDLFEQRAIFSVVGIDRSDHLLLLRRDRRGCLRVGDAGERQRHDGAEGPNFDVHIGEV